MMNCNSQLAQRFWKYGRLEDCPVLDFHGHMGPLAGGYLPACSPEDMLKIMDRANVAMLCFCSHQATMVPAAGTSGDIAVVQKYPERFKAYHSVVSRHLDPERDLADMEQYPDVFVGFKFLADYYKVPISDKRHDPYWEYADKHRLLVLVHTWGGSDYNCLRHAEEALERDPNLIFIAGHSFHGKWEGAVELAARYPNLYLELTAVLDDRGVLDYFVDKLGSERILFGTDLPWFATHHGIGAVMSADITDDDRRNILYRNGKKLLERFPWFEEFWNKYGGGAF